MKILIINSDSSKDDYFRNALNAISENQELIIFHSILEAENFIIIELIQKQKELDVIITELLEENNSSTREFCYGIRNNITDLFSNKNFKLSSIPIILFFEGRLDRDQYMNFGFDEVLDNCNDYFFHIILSTVKSVVKKWRNIVFDDS